MVSLLSGLADGSGTDGKSHRDDTGNDAGETEQQGKIPVDRAPVSVHAFLVSRLAAGMLRLSPNHGRYSLPIRLTGTVGLATNEVRFVPRQR
jgi:hypothetical protein